MAILQYNTLQHGSSGGYVSIAGQWVASTAPPPPQGDWQGYANYIASSGGMIPGQGSQLDGRDSPPRWYPTLYPGQRR